MTRRNALGKLKHCSINMICKKKNVIKNAYKFYREIQYLIFHNNSIIRKQTNNFRSKYFCRCQLKVFAYANVDRTVFIWLFVNFNLVE